MAYASISCAGATRPAGSRIKRRCAPPSAHAPKARTARERGRPARTFPRAAAPAERRERRAKLGKRSGGRPGDAGGDALAPKQSARATAFRRVAVGCRASPPGCPTHAVAPKGGDGRGSLPTPRLVARVASSRVGFESSTRTDTSAAPIGLPMRPQTRHGRDEKCSYTAAVRYSLQPACGVFRRSRRWRTWRKWRR